MKKIFIISLIAILIFSMSINTVYAAGTLDLYQSELKTFNGNLCTVEYYKPKNSTYDYAMIIGTRSVSYGAEDTFQLIFYEPGTVFTYDNGGKAWGADKNFLYLTYDSYEKAVDALFTQQETIEYKTTAKFPNFTYGSIYMYYENTYSNEAASTIEAAYYDWYVEKNGTEPTFKNPNVEDEVENNSSGIVAAIKELLQMVTPRLIGTAYLSDIGPMLSDRMEGNNFYSQATLIKDKLSELFNQNYRDPKKFQEINPLKLTLRRTVHATKDGHSYTYSDIDYGLNDVSLVGDMRWFFGTHYDTGNTQVFVNVDGSYAVKHYTDTIISALLWLGFGWYVFHNLPDLLSGDVGAVSSITSGIASRSSTQTKTITTTTDMATGKTSTKKTISRRG